MERGGGKIVSNSRGVLSENVCYLNFVWLNSRMYSTAFDNTYLCSLAWHMV